MKTNSKSVAIMVIVCLSLFLTAKATVHEYASSDVPKNIPDLTTIYSNLPVADSFAIRDIELVVNITHTFDGDLDVYLTAPDGTMVELFTDVGGWGDNFNDTILDDESATPITAGSAPFRGNYRPEGNLSVLDGKNVQGVWKLRVADDAGGDIGVLGSWKIRAQCFPPPQVTSPSPVNGATNVPLNTALSWNLPASPVHGSVTYDLLFGRASSSPPPLVRSNLTEARYQPTSPLDPDITYAWQVVAKSACGETMQGPRWSFTTVPNRPPIAPSRPSGPTSGIEGAPYDYSTSASDPDGDRVKYTFDWGDGHTTTTGFVNSGTTGSASHSWLSEGTYSVKAKATDSRGAESGWSSALSVSIERGNRPPVAKCKPWTVVNADENLLGLVDAYDVDDGSYDPDGDKIALSLEPSGPYELSATRVTLTVRETETVERLSDSNDAIVLVLPNAYCIKKIALRVLETIRTDMPTSSQDLKNAIGYLYMSLGDNASATAVAGINGSQVSWASPDRVATRQGDCTGKIVFEYQRRACGFLQAFIRGTGAPYAQAVNGVYWLLAEADKNLVDTAIWDAIFRGADPSEIEAAKQLRREADAAKAKGGNEILDVALPKYEEAWTKAMGCYDEIAEAVDNTSLSFTVGGNANWFRQTTTYYYDADAAQSGDVSHYQESWMQTTVDGPRTLKFWWKVSSEINYDWLEFYIDGVLQSRISGSANWQQKIYNITSGSHMLKWRYKKDVSLDAGSDCGWVDRIEW